MKKILILLAVLAVVLGSAFLLTKLASRHLGFSDGVTAMEPEGVFGEMATLPVGSGILYKDGLFVSLVEINDSRCPKDVECVWAGELRATFHVSGGSIETAQDVALALGADGTASRRSITTVDGYNISLDSVTTATVKAGEASTAKSKAAFLVDFAPEKAAETPPEDVGNGALKKDLIRVTNISANDTVESPLTVTGEARGTRYFEASFPVELLDEDGNSLAKGVAQAQSDWMTENFVPFTITLTFTAPPSGTTGTLVLHKDNPSGDPAKEDALIIPVQF